MTREVGTGGCKLLTPRAVKPISLRTLHLHRQHHTWLDDRLVPADKSFYPPYFAFTALNASSVAASAWSMSRSV